MSVLNEFAEKFGPQQSAWTKEQWRHVATELASRLDHANRPPAKRGRPRHDGPTPTEKNYAALAWQVQQRMEQAMADGRPLAMKNAVRAELVATIQWENNRAIKRGDLDSVIRESRVVDMLETAYTAVRKLLKKWPEEPEAGSAGAPKDSRDVNIRELIEDFEKRQHIKSGKRINLYARKRH
ncbi:hypothetical protein [Burkholderia arboris]|uniref:hypothetical protein n=1 Tax=Burkholderia arboris TaxID=488730 RepID=UPI00210BF6E1|nr:hypothetical protein [Burkholderia arboris]UTV54790.1 hypothetical protein NLX30_18200 [Burkholderia arboris]